MERKNTAAKVVELVTEGSALTAIPRFSANSGLRPRVTPASAIEAERTSSNEGTVKALQAELEAARKQLAERASEVNVLREELRRAENERQSLYTELEVHRSDLSRLSHEIASLRPSLQNPHSPSQASVPPIPSSPRAARFSSATMAAVAPPPLPGVRNTENSAQPPASEQTSFVPAPIVREDVSAAPADAAMPASEPLTSEYPSLRQVFFSEAPSSSRGSVPPSERRNNERRPCEFAVEFEHQTHFFAGLTQDISTGGLFVATYYSLPIGTRVSLRFELPDGTEISANGIVRWLRETDTTEARPGMGIELCELTNEALAKVSAFCTARPPLLFDA